MLCTSAQMNEPGGQAQGEKDAFSEALLPQFIEQIEKQTGAKVVPADGGYLPKKLDSAVL